jgi:TolA-binding protein
MAVMLATVTWRKSCTALLGAGLVLGMMPQIANAQSTSSAAPDDRLSRIETQLRALQRAVFPGGDQRFFEPEISASATPGTTPAQPTTSVSGTALTDVLARIEAIETQLARLTAATEVSGNALTTLQGRVDALEARNAATPSFGATIPAGPASSGAATVATPAPAASGTTRPASGTDRPAQATANTPTPAPAASGPTAERLAGVQAILKPSTADAGDDEYVYGFRLWEARFYPEAQQQLSLYLERYPRHSRVSFARNLLGRAYLDGGDPRRAATHFLENYQSDMAGARAPDSLLFLAESMVQLNDTNRACVALRTFRETYADLVTGRLATQYNATNGRARCP